MFPFLRSFVDFILFGCFQKPTGQPWRIVRRLSMRGIEISSNFKPSEAIERGIERGVSSPYQACAFMFIYVLSTISVKFMVHRLLGVHPPQGADKGIGTMLDDPKNQKLLQSFGIDTEDLKDFRKGL